MKFLAVCLSGAVFIMLNVKMPTSVMLINVKMPTIVVKHDKFSTQLILSMKTSCVASEPGPDRQIFQLFLHLNSY